MSVKVDLAELDSAIARYRYAFLITVSDAGTAHVLAVTSRRDGDHLVVDGLGRHSTTNATANPAVTLVWPPDDPADFSLIVDGRATVTEATLRIEPAKAILHRAAVDAEGTRTGNDCQPLT